MKARELARILSGAVVETAVKRHEALETACKIIEKESKSLIGTYKENWPPLAESTKKDREAKGFAADEPLLRTGALRDSIKHSVSGNKGIIGSDSKIAVYQELGTSRIPPRSFLMAAAKRKGKEAAEVAGVVMMRPLLLGRKY
jgi:phage gpG-like protein